MITKVTTKAVLKSTKYLAEGGTLTYSCGVEACKLVGTGTAKALTKFGNKALGIASKLHDAELGQMTTRPIAARHTLGPSRRSEREKEHDDLLSQILRENPPIEKMYYD